MRPIDLSAFGAELIRCRHDKGRLSLPESGTLTSILGLSADYVQLLVGDLQISVTVEGDYHKNELEDANRDSQRTMVVAIEDGPGVIELLVTRFSDVVLFGVELQIVLDETALPDGVDANTFFLREFILGDSAFALLRGEDSSRFDLVGHKRRMSIERDQFGLHRCAKIDHAPRQLEDLPIVRLRGSFSVLRGDQMTAASVHAGKMIRMLGKSNAYFDSWSSYNELERSVLESDAAEFGFFGYSNWQFDDSNEYDALIFSITDQAKKGLENSGIDWAVSASRPQKTDDKDRVMFPDDQIYVGKSVELRDNCLWLRLPEGEHHKAPPKKGFLYRSLGGDAVRLRRRDKALERAKQGNCPMWNLDTLLSTGEGPRAALRSHRPLSQSTIRAMGGFSPTASQKEALGVALNTPDLVLIQGPPGTGKTSVIRGLIARLLETEEKPRILVTSFQHDAVNNVIEGLDVDGVPAIRLGGPRIQEGALDPVLLRWADERQQLCQAAIDRIGEPPARAIARQVENLISHFRNVRGIQGLGLQACSDVIRLAAPLLSQELAQKATAVLGRLAASSSESVADDELPSDIKKQLLSVLYSQRCDRTSFDDDGPLHARRLVFTLERLYRSFRVKPGPFLTQAADIDLASSLHSSSFFLGLIEEVGYIKARAEGTHKEVDADSIGEIDQLLSEISRAVVKTASEIGGSMADAVVGFYQDLADPDQVRTIVERYSSVVAASCQQAAPTNRIEPWPVYDVVIVDEAARAMPLDLLIPMTMARKIVLVGDQNQLPHVLEQDVVDRLVEQKPSLAEFLSKSLFERLFEQFKTTAARGGIQRAVTLSDDFRMHPTIGRFISDTFYNKDVTPRRTAADRAHSLSTFRSRPVAWIDVPRSLGDEIRSESKARRAEASVVAKLVKKILSETETGSLGVVTFYNRQVRLIEEDLEGLPQHLRDRILVGTVDAFQGREFDFVLLSTVRSNSIRNDLRKSVGFVALNNRLCVALSRARRLLAVIGDSETISQIPAMMSFLRLCQTDEGHFERVASINQ